MGNEKTTSVNLGLSIPKINMTTSPYWETYIIDALNKIDTHDHSGSGKGLQITQSSLTITDDFNFNDVSHVDVYSIVFTNPILLSDTPSNASVYFLNGEFYAKDGSGNIIQFTQGGGLNATALGTISGNMSGSGASVTYFDTDKRFIFFATASAPEELAKIRAGVLEIGGTVAGSYSNVISLKSPTLSASYDYTLPNALPANDSFVSIDSSGVWSYVRYTSTNTASTAVQRDASGNFSAGTITASLTGNASTATTAGALTTARTIAGVSFDGSANIDIPHNSTSSLNSGDYRHLTETEKTTFDTVFTVDNAFNIVQKSSAGVITSSQQTEGVKLPMGTTLQRPLIVSADFPVIRYNTTVKELEIWVNGSWKYLPASTAVGYSLDDLVDVITGSPSDGQVLTYNSTSELWEPNTPTSSLAGLADVAITTPDNGAVLVYNDTTSKWEDGEISVESLSNINDTGRVNGSILYWDATTSKYVTINEEMRLGDTISFDGTKWVLDKTRKDFYYRAPIINGGNDIANWGSTWFKASPGKSFGWGSVDNVTIQNLRSETPDMTSATLRVSSNAAPFSGNVVSTGLSPSKTYYITAQMGTNSTIPSSTGSYKSRPCKVVTSSSLYNSAKFIGKAFNVTTSTQYGHNTCKFTYIGGKFFTSSGDTTYQADPVTGVVNLRSHTISSVGFYANAIIPVPSGVYMVGGMGTNYYIGFASDGASAITKLVATYGPTSSTSTASPRLYSIKKVASHYLVTQRLNSASSTTYSSACVLIDSTTGKCWTFPSVRNSDNYYGIDVDVSTLSKGSTMYVAHTFQAGTYNKTIVLNTATFTDSNMSFTEYNVNFAFTTYVTNVLLQEDASDLFVGVRAVVGGTYNSSVITKISKSSLTGSKPYLSITKSSEHRSMINLMQDTDYLYLVESASTDIGIPRGTVTYIKKVRKSDLTVVLSATIAEGSDYSAIFDGFLYFKTDTYEYKVSVTDFSFSRISSVLGTKHGNALDVDTRVSAYGSGSDGYITLNPIDDVNSHFFGAFTTGTLTAETYTTTTGNVTATAGATTSALTANYYADTSSWSAVSDTGGSGTAATIEPY